MRQTVVGRISDQVFLIDLLIITCSKGTGPSSTCQPRWPFRASCVLHHDKVGIGIALAIIGDTSV
ncbi:hypothetical protein JMJ77_0000594 [Colletotrichum scovillei]|uniref:Uncharacterized protein n=1 Tax=Colletotrichum scovillei TaxID=1209932 RepID=A0A9P7RCJ5_9PEZI|nr:hypothetical protein JMJ77_0000594 [Colletotrichum scovillei]KAG7071802.1 hypothetical protein JMJ76_0004670 [Colletotrichum scovillei]KAG7080054.1 hypothetical protein JMJ78_0007156 [Colletotrichum scovillei]